MRLLLATFGVAVASALIPLVNIEAYIAGVAALASSFGLWPLAAVAAAGQTVGKLVWYQVGRSSMNWRYIRKRLETPGWQRRYTRMHALIADRAVVGRALLFLSAILGLPPLAIMAVLAGQLAFHRLWFVLTILLGRTLRFAAVLGGISALSHSGLF